VRTTYIEVNYTRVDDRLSVEELFVLQDASNHDIGYISLFMGLSSYMDVGVPVCHVQHQY
jgi:hypothetical protein